MPARGSPEYHEDQRIIFVQTGTGSGSTSVESKDDPPGKRFAWHVPAVILPALDDSKTLNGKKVESAVTCILNDSCHKPRFAAESGIRRLLERPSKIHRIKVTMATKGDYETVL